MKHSIAALLKRPALGAAGVGKPKPVRKTAGARTLWLGGEGQPEPPPESMRTPAMIRSQRSLLNTVAKVVGVGRSPFLPIHFEQVARALKKRGFRSTKNNLSAMKRQHIKENFDWTHQHSQAFTGACKFSVRGLGAPARARPFRLRKIIIAHRLRKIPLTGFKAPTLVTLLSSRFVFRSIEVAACKWRHVRICTKQKTVTVLVPSSKTDIEGFGVRIKFACSCPLLPGVASGFGYGLAENQSHIWMNCVYHLSIAFALEVHGSLNAPSGVAGNNFYFATRDGSAPSLQSLAAMVNSIASRHNIDESEDEAEEAAATRPHFSGHSFRRSGAREWHREGVRDNLLKTLGRWSTSAWERYVAELPLAVIAPLEPTMHQSPIMAVYRALHDLSSQVKTLASRMSPSASDVTIQPQAGTAPARFVVSHPGESQAKTHLLATFRGRRADWRTKCGFKFGTALCDVEIADVQPMADKCRDCFGLRAVRGTSSDFVVGRRRTAGTTT